MSSKFRSLGMPLILASLAALTACERQPAPVAPTQTGASPAPTATEDACMSTGAWQQAGKGELRVEDKADEQGFEIHFTLVQGGKTINDWVRLPSDTAEAITDELGEGSSFARVCADRWFIQNLAFERGGMLVIGSLQDGGLAMSTKTYDSGDEETARVTWDNGKPMITTSVNGAQPLPTVAPGRTLAPGTGTPVTHDCESEDEHGTQLLSLALDSTGRLRSVGYSSIMPGAGGTSCNVDATRGDGTTTWNDESGKVEIGWGNDTTQPSILRVAREDRRYTVDTRALPFLEFCGQSAQMALSVALQADEKTCVRSTWPGN